jgi:hypothetical protein
MSTFCAHRKELKMSVQSKKVSSKQPELIPGQPRPQADNKIINVRIADICEHRERYNISPEYQREDVWNKKECQQLIDTILHGLGIGLLEGYKYREGGKTYFEMLDGHQRMRAIIRFYDGDYKTWSPLVKKRARPISKDGPIEPGKLFEQLSPYVKDYFLDYNLAISITPEMTLEERAARFLDIQCQKPTTPAERLNVYPSKANRIAREKIACHPFWADFYIGDMGRKQLFISSLYLLALQITAPAGKADLRNGTFVTRVATGEYDGVITDAFVATVLERLDDMHCVYHGMQFTDRAAVIAMYQSVMFVRQAGCEIKSSTHKGSLTKWLDSILAASKRASGLPVYHRPIQNLLYAKGQVDFWERHLREVLVRFQASDQLRQDYDRIASSVGM